MLGFGFVVAFGGRAVPGSAWAQAPAKVHRIGYIVVTSAKEQTHLTLAFEYGTRELGYVEGRNVVYERRFADGDQGRLPELAADSVKREVDVNVVGANPVIANVMQTTTTILLVMAISSDPVGAGFITSYARPGGNIIGLAADPVPEVHWHSESVSSDGLIAYGSNVAAQFWRAASYVDRTALSKVASRVTLPWNRRQGSNW